MGPFSLIFILTQALFKRFEIGGTDSLTAHGTGVVLF